MTDSHFANGHVQLEYADKPDWYKYKISESDNTLSIVLSGEPTIRTNIIVVNQKGKIIHSTTQIKENGSIHNNYAVESSQFYYVKVIEPPRNVIFAWDTSGSTGAYHAIIFKALRRFTQVVIAGRDEVNFIPFGGELLMDKWYGESYLLKTILNNYPRNHNSSTAESSLHKSNIALADRNGSKAIIVITDAITNRDAIVWDSFKRTQPRVFSIGLVKVVALVVVTSGKQI